MRTSWEAGAPVKRAQLLLLRLPGLLSMACSVSHSLTLPSPLASSWAAPSLVTFSLPGLCACFPSCLDGSTLRISPPNSNSPSKLYWYCISFHISFRSSGITGVSGQDVPTFSWPLSQRIENKGWHISVKEAKLLNLELSDSTYYKGIHVEIGSHLHEGEYSGSPG